MDGIHPHFTLRVSFSFLLMALLQTPAQAQELCTAPPTVTFEENNTIGAVVTPIAAQPGVIITFQPPPANPENPFVIAGHQLVADKVLDYEIQSSYTARLTCTASSNQTSNIRIIVGLSNLNDNPPNFEKSLYQTDVNELSPVNSVVGNFPATDLDLLPLYYRLTPESSGFRLRSVSVPEILVETPLEYKVRQVQLILYVQDEPLTPATGKVASTASTTIVITIKDVDNRPPWFQPCTLHEIGGILICQNKGYTGKIILNQMEPGALELKPSSLHAVDGDSGINATITYSFLSGNDDGLFHIHPNTGAITMLKVADELKTITLTVMAAQTVNSYQFATTTATISVVSPSSHHPRFQKSQYAGIISGVGIRAEDATSNQPLVILATDEDYTATGGLNPYITYAVNGSSDFSIVNGYLFMMKELPEETLALQVVAVDTSNKQSATAQLSVQVTSGVTTTTVPLSTTTPIGVSTTSSKTTEAIGSTTKPSTSTDSSVSTTLPSVTTTTVPLSTTTSIGVSTTSSKTTEAIGTTTKPSTSTESGVSTTLPSVTSENTIATTNSITSTEGSTTQPHSGITTTPADGTATTPGGETTTTKGSVSTITPSLTSEGGVSTASTAYPHTEIVPPGGYRMEDMAALGASLGVILFICLVVIGVLFFYIRRGKADWQKIYETSMFRSSLGQGPGGQKEVIQYTNDAFQNDDDGGNTSSGGPEGRTAGGELWRAGEDTPDYEQIVKSSVALQGLLHDDTSQAGSDRSDSEKEVRPILTKERRMDEGYKSVWFKEDIDPDAKVEVVIIPDSKDNDSESEDDEQPSSSRVEDEEDNL